ncbi:MAG: ATP-binding cassette domain-containing protein [Legionellales bacterium]|nr:ATP-binding cassette domain-containing protein [Legionellales bacterium]
MSNPLMIEQLSHRYAQHPILRNIHLTVARGEFLSVLGPSGCGKSTLLRLIAGLEQPWQGTIRLANRLVFDNGRSYLPTEQRRLGFVFQDYALFSHQTVTQNIAFGLAQTTKQQRVHTQQRVRQLLDLIDMPHYANRYPCELSGGQQQRVALARALAPRPTLLLLDEPFANIDATIRQELGQALQTIVMQEGVSVILVTHDRREAFALADRAAILQKSPTGTYIAQCDTPEHVYHYPVNPNVAQLTGNASFIAAQANGHEATTAIGSIALSQPSQGPGQLLIRPEMATFVTQPQGPAIVIHRIFHGHCYRLVCQQHDVQIEVEVPLTLQVSIGDRGNIRIHQPCLLLNDA